MKNQYFGDINDYLKYGMLRAFGQELSVAVIWMMTPDDGSRDGRKLEYLETEGRRNHDPELYDWLREWYRAGAARNVRLIEESGLLPNCRFSVRWFLTTWKHEQNGLRASGSSRETPISYSSTPTTDCP